jgi:hypothetical protein
MERKKRKRSLIFFRFFHPQRRFFGTRLKDDLWGYVTDKGYGLHPTLFCKNKINLVKKK